MDSDVDDEIVTKTEEYDYVKILRRQQLVTRVTIPLLLIYLIRGILKYNEYEESYYDGCYTETVYRFRMGTLILIVLGYLLPYYSTNELFDRVRLGYLLLITLVIAVFHWLDGQWLGFDCLHVTFASVLIIFHPYLYGPVTLGRIHDSLYFQCVISILITSTGILLSSLSLLTDRLNFYWKAPIPLYTISYLSMVTASFTGILSIDHPA